MEINLISTMSVIATVMSVGGNVLLAKKLKAVFLIWIISNVLWIIIIIMSSMNIPQLCMYAIYIGTSLYSWTNWTKDERKS